MKSKAAHVISGLRESPMPGDPPSPRYWQPGYSGAAQQLDRTREIKAAARDSLATLFGEVGEVEPRGEFQLNVKVGDQTWKIRQTSNAIRVLAPVSFDVSGCPRELAAKVIIAAMNSGVQ